VSIDILIRLRVQRIASLLARPAGILCGLELHGLREPNPKVFFKAFRRRLLQTEFISRKKKPPPPKRRYGGCLLDGLSSAESRGSDPAQLMEQIRAQSKPMLQRQIQSSHTNLPAP